MIMNVPGSTSAISCMMVALEPVPRASMMMTDDTPMMMPSMVRKLRILLAPMALRAILNKLRIFIVVLNS